MFQWLAKMLIHTPMQSSGCSCCEEKRERMEHLRRQIIGEENFPEPEKDVQSAQEIQQCACQEYVGKIFGVTIHGCYPIIADKPEENDSKE